MHWITELWAGVPAGINLVVSTSAPTASVKSLQSDTVKCKANSQCKALFVDSGPDQRTSTPLLQSSVCSAVSATNDSVEGLMGLLGRPEMLQGQTPVNVSNQAVAPLAFHKPCRVCTNSITLQCHSADGKIDV